MLRLARRAVICDMPDESIAFDCSFSIEAGGTVEGGVIGLADETVVAFAED